MMGCAWEFCVTAAGMMILNSWQRKKDFPIRLLITHLRMKWHRLCGKKRSMRLFPVLRRTKGERILEEFDTRDFYAMVRKGNTELLDEINYAIDQMNAAGGDWKNALQNKYYTHTLKTGIYPLQSRSRN